MSDVPDSSISRQRDDGLDDSDGSSSDPTPDFDPTPSPGGTPGGSSDATAGDDDDDGDDDFGGGGDDDPDPSPGPSTGGGEPSFPGGPDPGTPEPDPDPSPGPSTGGGEPSFPGGSDPGNPDTGDPSPGPSTPGGEPSFPGGPDPGNPDTGGDDGPTAAELGDFVTQFGEGEITRGELEDVISGDDPDPTPDIDPTPSPGGTPGGSPDDTAGGGADDPTPEFDPTPSPGGTSGGSADATGGGGGGSGGGDVPSQSITRTRPDPTVEADADVGVLDGFSETLESASENYTEEIAEPFGDVVGDATPATAIEGRLTGTNVSERLVESTASGVAQLGNVPAGILATGSAVDRLDEDLGRGTQRQTQVGVLGSTAIVPDAGTREVARDFGSDAVRVAGAAASNPVETTGSLFGAGIGGAVASRAAFGAARRARGSGSDVDVGEVEAVSTGRENVGTGGLDDILDADTIDDARGVTGPSRTARARASLERSLDDIAERVTEGVDDAVSQFVPEAGETGSVRSGLVPRSATERDTPDAPTDFDSTRPPGAGGTFEDVRDDALTQIQDDLEGRARRPDPGDFDGAGQPFGRDRGPLFNPETGEVELQRSTATPGRAPQTGATNLATTFDDTATGVAAGSASAVGSIDDVNDPTGIAGRSTPDYGLDAGDSLPGGSLAGGDSAGVDVDPVNDPTGIADTGSDTDTGSTTAQTPADRKSTRL